MPIALLAFVRIAYDGSRHYYANSAHDIQHKGQAALWVTNGRTSMSKPITTLSTPMGVDDKTGALEDINVLISSQDWLNFHDRLSEAVSDQ